MGLQHIYPQILADRKKAVREATWGHLAPKEDKEYSGYLLFAHNCYGDRFVIDWKFDVLESSPWFYDCLQEFMLNFDTEDGKIYKFTGTFCNYKFKGDMEEIKIKGEVEELKI